MQLDLFDDSREVLLRHDVVALIEARAAADARQALNLLLVAYPKDRLAPTLDTLVRHLESPPSRFESHDAALAALKRLEGNVLAAAAHLLPASWIAQEWESLAAAASGLAYAASATQAHPAYFFLQAKNWTATEVAVMTIASWRRIPLPLSWMAEARLGRDGFAAAWPLLCELAWLAPTCLAAAGLEDPTWQSWRRDFDAGFENDGDDPDLAWLPAWSLIVEPRLAPLLRQTEAGLGRNPERAARLILEILSLERQGSQALLLEHRKKLRSLNSSLFARYLQTR